MSKAHNPVAHNHDRPDTDEPLQVALCKEPCAQRRQPVIFAYGPT